jgi:hypothetical protein
MQPFGVFLCIPCFLWTDDFEVKATFAGEAGRGEVGIDRGDWFG